MKTVLRTFYRMLMKDKEYGHMYVTAKFYAFGGEAELQEGASWVSLTDSCVQVAIEVEDDAELEHGDKLLATNPGPGAGKDG